MPSDRTRYASISLEALIADRVATRFIDHVVDDHFVDRVADRVAVRVSEELRARSVPSKNDALSEPHPGNTKVLRLPAVTAETGLGKSTVYEKVAAGTFPRPIDLGGQRVGWLSHEVQAWIVARIADSRPVGTGVPAVKL